MTRDSVDTGRSHYSQSGPMLGNRPSEARLRLCETLRVSRRTHVGIREIPTGYGVP